MTRVLHRHHIAETVHEEVIRLRVLAEVNSFLILILFDLFINQELSILVLQGLSFQHFKFVRDPAVFPFEHVPFSRHVLVVSLDHLLQVSLDRYAGQVQCLLRFKEIEH